jgi:hypothetical protein
VNDAVTTMAGNQSDAIARSADAFDALDRRIDYLSDRVVVITGQPGTIQRNPTACRKGVAK